MARIPYIDEAQAGPPELVAAIKARRGGQLAMLDRMLLHSPPVAEGWGPLMGRGLRWTSRRRPQPPSACSPQP